MTITIHLTPDLERQLHEISTARGVPAEQIVVGALSTQLRQACTANELPHLSAQESKLLLAINEGLSDADWQRYHALTAKRDAETLSPEEQQQLIDLSDRLETLNFSRIQRLTELAQIRGISLGEVMDQLGIRRPEL